MNTKEALELAISELDIASYNATNESEYDSLLEAIQKLVELLETI